MRNTLRTQRGPALGLSACLIGELQSRKREKLRKLELSSTGRKADVPSCFINLLSVQLIPTETGRETNKTT